MRYKRIRCNYNAGTYRCLAECTLWKSVCLPFVFFTPPNRTWGNLTSFSHSYLRTYLEFRPPDISYYLSSEQQRCWSDCSDAHLCYSHMAKAGFVMTWLIIIYIYIYIYWKKDRLSAANLDRKFPHCKELSHWLLWESPVKFAVTTVMILSFRTDMPRQTV